MPHPTITHDIHLKLREQIERTEHLIRMVPTASLAWKPPVQRPAHDLGHLLGHLLDCLAGFCAVFVAAFPRELAQLAELQSLQVNHACQPDEAIARLREYAGHIDRGFALCTDDDLRRLIPSVFVPEGESLATLLLGNLEHLINHKYQLFLYLKLLGLLVTSKDIYHWRGAPEGNALAEAGTGKIPSGSSSLWQCPRCGAAMIVVQRLTAVELSQWPYFDSS